MAVVGTRVNCETGSTPDSGLLSRSCTGDSRVPAGVVRWQPPFLNSALNPEAADRDEGDGHGWSIEYVV